MGYRNRVVAGALCALSLLLSPPSWAQSPDGELLFGVAPFMSPDALYRRMEPLRDYLSRKLERNVVLELNRDVQQLVKRTDAERYDLIFTGPTFALKALDSGLYLPGVIPNDDNYFLVLVKRESTVQTVQGLAGKVVATPPAMGTISKLASLFFREQGLTPEKLPEFVAYASHNAAFLAMMNGDVDAAIIGSFAYRDIESAMAGSREVARTGKQPGVSLILAKHLPQGLREQVVQLMETMKDDAEGRLVLEKIKFEPFRRSTVEEFTTVRRYLGAQ